MSEHKAILLVTDETNRARISEYLRARGWVCAEANDVASAQRLQKLHELHVVLADIEFAQSREFQNWHAETYPHAQLISMLGDKSVEPSIDSRNSSFAILTSVSTPLWQIEHTMRRATQYSTAVSSDSEHLGAAYRKLFEASVALYTAETFGDLLESCCREIARGAGFGRAIIVMADERHRIQTVRAFFADAGGRIELNDYIGRPLLPVLPESTVDSLGKGFGISLLTDSQPVSSRHLILPLEQRDGTVLGFVTLDLPKNNTISLAHLSEPLALLLNFVTVILELQTLRSQRGKPGGADSRDAAEKIVELRAAQERFTRLVGLTEDIVYITDAQGRLIYLNESFTSTLGFAKENYVGKQLASALSDLSTDSSASSIVLDMLESKEQERVKHELELFSKSGYRRPFVLTHQWIRQGHEIVAGQGILRDITERRELLTELMRSERLSAAGRHASGVAHEINNPLQAISSHLSGLSARLASDQKALDSIGIVADSVDRIRLLTRSMMDLQRPDQLIRTKSDVKDVVEKALALHSPQLRAASVEIVRNFAPELPLAPIRPAEIEQVCINLISNALQAMPDGGKLTVSIQSVEKSLHVDFCDTGRGIAPEIQPRLFEPFATFREQGGGLGLGLYLSRQIMQQHGGELQAESPPGGGARFSMILPLDQ